jgi:signal transduction histidine kinase
VPARSKQFEAARLALAQLELSSDDGALERVLDDATRISAGALSVDRVGVWLFTHGGAELHCIWQYDALGSRANIPLLRTVVYPAYIQALHEHRFIVADDARAHPQTHDLAQDYLEPLGITSMLDAPVYRGSELIGIVCHEHTGEQRHWTDAECALAGTVADVIALVFEQARSIRLEQDLGETRAKLRELAMLDDVTRIVAAAAHDLNNLLSMIIASVALCETHLDDPEAIQRMMRDLTEVTGRASVLVRRLMGLRRAAEPLSVEIQLAPLVSRLSAVLHAVLGSERQLVLEVPDNTSLAVLAEPLPLEQALVNLVTNARQATPPSGVVRISFATAEREIDKQRKRFVVIEVHDNGVGMSEAIKNKALEAFFTTRGAHGGSGLGLHIVATMARRSGGFVEIESGLGTGTAVRIFLPRADSSS